MRYLAILFIAALGLAACADSHLEKNQVDAVLADSGIVGGTEAAPEDPRSDFVVMIRGKYADGRGYICTGAVVDKDIILTAAHCLGELDTMQIIFGVDPLKSGATQLAKVKDVYKHKHYDKGSQVRNDIALIQMTEKIPPYFEMAKLPWSQKKIAAPHQRMKLKTYGFGVTSGVRENGKIDVRSAGVLRLVNLKFIDISPYEDAFYVDQTQGKGICSGDSGGPAFDNNNIVIGITSYAITDDPQQPEKADDDACNFKSVFTNVTHYKDWILKGMETLHSKKQILE